MALRSSCSKLMGDLLLKGHIMCAEACPDCQVPLMRDPETRVGFCVNCESRYDEAGTRLTDSNKAPAPFKAATANGGLSTEDSALSFTRPSQAAEDTQGNTQMSSTHSDDVADAIAGKLQSGWALLDTACPRCNTPLVRERGSKRMFCCSCDAWVLTERQAAEQFGHVPSSSLPHNSSAPANLDKQQAPSAPTTSPPPPATRPPPGPTAAQPRHTPTRPGTHVSPTPGLMNGTVTSPRSTAALLSSAPAIGNGGLQVVKNEEDGSPVDTDDTAAGVGSAVVEAVCGRVESAIVHQLSDLAYLLESTSLVSQGHVGAVDSLERVVKLTSDCLAVLGQLKSLKA